MEQWSILSNVIIYVQYIGVLDYYKLDAMALEPKTHRKIHDKLKGEDRQVI